MYSRTTRRTILQMMGMSALAALLLGPQQGRADTTARKRLVWIASPVGTIIEKLWAGNSFDDLFGSGMILQPDDNAGFSSLKPKLAVLRGIDVKSAYKQVIPKDHQPDYLNMLIARQPKDPDGAMPAGISMDQVIAKALAKDPSTTRPFSSVTLGTATNFNSWNSFVATGEDQPVAPIQDPSDAFHQLFDGFSGAPDQSAKRNAERLSVLDTVSGELSSLEKRLSCDDRVKLAAHVDSIAELEKQIKLLSETTCAAPAEPAKADYDAKGESYPAIVKAHMDLIVATLACDLSRVVTLQLGRRLMQHSWLGIPYEHHVLAHSNAPGHTTEEQRAMQAKIEHWYAQQFYYLLRKLDAIPDDNGGTLLDNTVIVWAHEQASGSSHSRKDHSYVVAGNCGGALPTGFRKDYRNAKGEGAAHSGLLMTLAHAMGVEVNEFGDPDFSNGPLTL